MKLDDRALLFIEALQHRSFICKAELETTRSEIIRLLNEAGDQALSRNHATAHCTASALICDVEGSVLALFHRKLSRWLQPGGHIEPSDMTPMAAALREASEESGLMDLIPLSEHPIDVDIHEIPSRPHEASHFHYDIRYAFLAPHPELIRCSAESLEIKWLSGDGLTQWCASDESINRLVLSGLERLKSFKSSSEADD